MVACSHIIPVCVRAVSASAAQDGALAAELLLHLNRSTRSSDLLIMLSELQVRPRSLNRVSEGHPLHAVLNMCTDQVGQTGLCAHAGRLLILYI